jgi:hypothetical protein
MEEDDKMSKMSRISSVEKIETMAYDSIKLQKILIDSSLIVDFLLNRPCPVTEDINSLFHLITRREIKGYISSLGLEFINSCAKIRGGESLAEKINSKLEALFEICEVKKEMIDNVKKSSLPTLHNAIYLECSIFYELDAILTLDPEGFKPFNTNIPKSPQILTPSQYVSAYYNDDIQALLHELELEHEPTDKEGLSGNTEINQYLITEIEMPAQINGEELTTTKNQDNSVISKKQFTYTRDTKSKFFFIDFIFTVIHATAHLFNEILIKRGI